MKYKLGTGGTVLAVDGNTGKERTCRGIHRAIEDAFCVNGMNVAARRNWSRHRGKRKYTVTDGLNLEAAVIAWWKRFSKDPATPVKSVGSKLAEPLCQLIKDKDWILLATQLPVGYKYVGTRVDALATDRSSGLTALGNPIRSKNMRRSSRLPKVYVVEIKLSDSLKERIMTRLQGPLQGHAPTRSLFAHVQAIWAATLLDKQYGQYRFIPHLFVAHNTRRATIQKTPKWIYDKRVAIVKAVAATRKRGIPSLYHRMGGPVQHGALAPAAEIATPLVIEERERVPLSRPWSDSGEEGAPPKKRKKSNESQSSDETGSALDDEQSVELVSDIDSDNTDYTAHS